jgi:hypothetical protein
MNNLEEFTDDATKEMASATTRAREAIQEGVRYFQEREMEDVVSDLGALIRRRPVESLIAAAAIGFLAARFLQREGRGPDE